jgi:superfamily II DNA or RNA helicase
MALLDARQVELVKGDRVRIHLNRWAMHSQDPPILSADLEGELKAVTPKAILFVGIASTQEARNCHRCGLYIKNPVSVVIGYGPDCCEHLGIHRPANDEWTEEQKDEIRQRIAETSAVEVWLPRSTIKIEVIEHAPKIEPKPAPAVAPDLAKVSAWLVTARKSLEAIRRGETVGNWTEETLAAKIAEGEALLAPIAPAPVAVPAFAASVENGVIYVRCPYDARFLAKAIAGCRGWDGTSKRWKYLATYNVAKAIAGVFPQAVLDDGFRALLRQADEAGKAVAHKTATDLPAIPVTKTEPWTHQLQTYHFARELNGAGIFLDMGCGKSKVAVDLIVNRGHRRTLIIAPLKVLNVWPAQFEIHAGKPIRVVVLGGDTRRQMSVEKKAALAREAIAQSDRDGMPLVIVVNYESAWRSPFGPTYSHDGKQIVALGLALETEWDCVILDEAHRIKSAGGKASLFMSRLGKRVPYRLALTGTPMPHSPIDVYALYRFLDPSVFGTSKAAFEAEYAVKGGYGGYQILGYRNVEKMNEKIYSIAHRVRSEDVLDLPEFQHIERYCELGSEALRAYRQLEDDFVASLGEEKVTVTNALTKLLRLQQITGGYVPDDNGQTHRVDTAKAELLMDVLEDLDEHEPLVIFARFHDDLNEIHAAVKKTGRTTVELSGRKNELDRWQAGEADVLVTQVNAGKEGIDLTRARYAIYYSLGFSLGDYEQSLKRTHRPGQTRKCIYVHLIATGTVDQKVYRALSEKKSVVEYVLSEMGSVQLAESA